MTRLPPEALRRACDPSRFSFQTTAELDELHDAIGQQRAVEAITFGIRIQHPGYNIFAMGPTGMGKHYVVRQFLEQAAASRPTPSGWCYVHNFDVDHAPVALELPQGRCAAFKADVTRLVQEVRASLSVAFEGEDYLTRRRAFEEALKARQQAVIADIEAEAADDDILILRSPGGLALAPAEDGEVMSQEAFDALEEDEQADIEAMMEAYRERLAEALQQEPAWKREQREQVRGLNREVATEAVTAAFSEVAARYGGLEPVQRWFERMCKDVVEHATKLVAAMDPDPETQAAVRMAFGGADPFSRYEVNILVEHQADRGAPVVYEAQPTVYNLVGRVEHHARMGALETDFSLIRPGALHQANGGYLILEARRLLSQPHAWEQLKSALRAGEIRTRSLEQLLDRVTTVTLEPAPIPLDVKVVLIGERYLYDALADDDPEFEQLFKVTMDFDEDMIRDEQGEALFARLLATLARKGKLRPLGPSAVASVVEHAGRMAEDRQKLSIHIQFLSDLLREADYYADMGSSSVIEDAHVREALETRRRRSARLQERLQEDTERGITLIDTQGSVVGQINGLSVLVIGQVAFGRPNRITATVTMGDGSVVDIEREVELGGAFHSKGVLILTGFLTSRYVDDFPLSFQATLTMEQSYTDIDGDSATCAEVCALMSAISGVPIKQELAITGSMNQRGQVQAIGGVNEKIEGFFDVCRAQGLTGQQGVIIPASNADHLMLREDLVEAARQGLFHIHAVRTIDEAMTLLTGMPAGAANKEGAFPPGTLNRAVADSLREQARKSRDWND